MQQSLGRGPQQRADFVDKMELLVKRYAPYLLDEELDEEFASQLQAADAREEEPWWYVIFLTRILHIYEEKATKWIV